MTSDDPACPELVRLRTDLPGAARGGPLSHALSRVSRLHRITAGKLLRQTGLYPGQEFLMMHLWEVGAARQSELIKSVDLDPSTVTKMLQRLEQTGYVRRSPDPRDRRAVVVEATSDSCALRSQVEGAWVGLEKQTLTGLDDGERVELARLLAKIEANLCGPEPYFPEESSGEGCAASAPSAPSPEVASPTATEARSGA